MNATTYKVIVLAIAIAQLVLSNVIGDATAFSIGSATVKVLGIAAAVLTLVANYLPSLFGVTPAVTTGTPKP